MMKAIFGIIVSVFICVISFTFMPINVDNKALIADYQNTVTYSKSVEKTFEVVPTQSEAVQNQIASIALNGNGSTIMGSNDPRLLYFPAEDTKGYGLKQTSGFHPRDFGAYPFHYGIDIAIQGADKSGHKIRSATQGKVVTSTLCSCGLGNYIEIIDPRNNFRYTYAHLKSRTVGVNDVIEAGDEIGIMGNTGIGSGVHLHFEIKPNEALIDKNKVKTKMSPQRGLAMDPNDRYFTYLESTKPSSLKFENTKDLRDFNWGNPGGGN